MEKEFESVYNQYYLSVYLYIFKRIQHQQDAEDLTEEVFMACYKNFEKYDSQKASLVTWIFVITNNKLKNYYRDKKEYLSIDDEENPVDIASGDSMEQAVLLEEAREWLLSAIESLPEREQEIIRMRYFQRRSFNEIALYLHLTSGNVRVLLNRSLTKLKKYLLAHHYEI